MALMLQFTLVTGNMILTTINVADLMDGKHRSTTAWAGITLGALAGAVEFKMMLDHLQYYPLSLRTGSTIMGGVSVLAGVYALATRERAARPLAREAPARLRAAPLLEPTRAGLALNLNF